MAAIDEGIQMPKSVTNFNFFFFSISTIINAKTVNKTKMQNLEKCTYKKYGQIN